MGKFKKLYPELSLFVFRNMLSAAVQPSQISIIIVDLKELFPGYIR